MASNVLENIERQYSNDTSAQNLNRNWNIRSFITEALDGVDYSLPKEMSYQLPFESLL